jgi:hypothetical protein
MSTHGVASPFSQEKREKKLGLIYALVGSNSFAFESLGAGVPLYQHALEPDGVCGTYSIACCYRLPRPTSSLGYYRYSEPLQQSARYHYTPLPSPSPSPSLLPPPLCSSQPPTSSSFGWNHSYYAAPSWHNLPPVHAREGLGVCSSQIDQPYYAATPNLISVHVSHKPWQLSARAKYTEKPQFRQAVDIAKSQDTREKVDLLIASVRGRDAKKKTIPSIVGVTMPPPIVNGSTFAVE